MAVRVGGGSPLLREINCAAVLDVLRSSGPLRLADLVRLTGLSRPTVGQATTQLVTAGWVEYVDEDPTGGPRQGRPARLARFRSQAGYVVGIDVGPHKVLAATLDLGGDLVATRRRSTRHARTAREVLAVVHQTVEELLTAGGVARSGVEAVTVGTPGIIDSGTDTVVKAPSLPGWTSIGLSQEVGRWFDCPVHIENDANLAAIAERWCGAAVGAETVVFIQWGSRLGAGILLGGQLHRGDSGAAGEIGYFTSPGTGAGAHPDAAGLGPFERGIGTAAIVKLAAGTDSGHPVLSRRLNRRSEEIDAAEVFASAADGNHTAQHAIDTVAARFAAGLAAVILVLDPGIIVIGGGVSNAGPILLAGIKRHLPRLVLTVPRLELSTLGDEAVALGAARLALTRVEHRLFGATAEATTAPPEERPSAGAAPLPSAGQTR